MKEVGMMERVLKLARQSGADLAGWAAIDRGELELYSLLSPEDAKRYRSALVVAMSHQPEAFVDPPALPTEAYDQDYRRLNAELNKLVSALESFLNEEGITCRAVPSSQTLDTMHQRGLVSHRALAQRAGLGVRGRNNLLVTLPHRSHLRLASVLTKMRVPHAPEMIVPYPCVECNKCREVCPARALGENPTDFRLDLCLAHLEKIHKKPLSPQICGICQAVCPGMELRPN